MPLIFLKLESYSHLKVYVEPKANLGEIDPKRSPIWTLFEVDYLKFRQDVPMGKLFFLNLIPMFLLSIFSVPTYGESPSGRFDNMLAHSKCLEISHSKYQAQCIAQMDGAVFDKSAAGVCGRQLNPYERFSCFKSIRNKVYQSVQVFLCEQNSRSINYCLANNSVLDLDQLPALDEKTKASLVRELDLVIRAYSSSQLESNFVQRQILSIEKMIAKILEAK